MRADIEAIAPDRIKRRPVDHRDFPVPYFVVWIDGKPDFRLVMPGRLGECFKNKICWICGEPLGRFLAFAIGPMCVVNRTTSEPAQHLECAQFAAKACPFLTNPQACRRSGGLPEHSDMPGEPLLRNPGVVAVYVTRDYQPFDAGNGYLFHLGDPTTVHWYVLGKEATRAQIDEAMAAGLPAIMEMAESESPKAVAALNRCVAKAQIWLPTRNDPAAGSQD